MDDVISLDSVVCVVQQSCLQFGSFGHSFAIREIDPAAIRHLQSLIASHFDIEERVWRPKQALTISYFSPFSDIILSRQLP